MHKVQDGVLLQLYHVILSYYTRRFHDMILPTHTCTHARMHTTTTTSPPHNYLTHTHICTYIPHISLHGYYHHRHANRNRMQQAIALCTRTHSLTSPCPCATCNWLLLLVVPKMVITCNLHWWCIFFCQLSQLLMCTWACLATCIVWLWW